MSITISWCDVCGDGSLEGDPEQTCCISCGQSFHVHCASDRKGLREYFEAEEEIVGEGDEMEYVDRGDCPAEFCPRCQGVWEDPKVKEFSNGYTFSLLVATPSEIDAQGNEKKILKGELLLHLIEWFSNEDSKVLIPLDLSGFTEADEEAYKLLEGHYGNVDLRDIATLTDGQIEMLSKIHGELVLGVTELSLPAWESLSNRQKETSIRGVESMSVEAAKLFVGKKVDLRIGLTGLTPELVELLGKGEGMISFPDVNHISEEVVDALVKTERSIFLYGLKTPSDLEEGEEKKALLVHMDKICDRLRSNEKINLPYPYAVHGQEEE
jgi:hypothetical protein